MAIQLFRAKEAEIYIGDAIETVSDTATIYSQLTSVLTISDRVKSIEFSGGESDTESVYLFGADADGRQNAVSEEQNITDVEFSGTLLLNDNVPLTWASADATSVGSTGFTRAQGDGAREQKCIVVKYVDTVTDEELHLVMNNAYFTKIGDISSDSEGHAEQEVAAKCLGKDFFQEYSE
jgi:hypothetical protein